MLRFNLWIAIVLSIILLVIGGIFGVYCAQYEYFEISKSISLSDILICLFTSAVAIVIAYNIQRALTSQQTTKALFQEDIKQFIDYLKTLEDWIQSGFIPAKELRSHMSIGNVKLRFILSLYDPKTKLNTKSLQPIIDSYNNLKVSLTELNTIQEGQAYEIEAGDVQVYIEKVEDIKRSLMNAILDC